MTQSRPSPQNSPTPADEVRRLYEETEARTAKAFDDLVNRPSFGEVLAKVTENVVALTRISNDAADLVLRNLRLAGRQDLMRVGRQMARTEDKLEMVLQEVERLREELGSRDAAAPSDGSGETGRGGLAEGRSPGTRENSAGAAAGTEG